MEDPRKSAMRYVSRSGQNFDFWGWCLCRSGQFWGRKFGHVCGTIRTILSLSPRSVPASGQFWRWSLSLLGPSTPENIILLRFFGTFWYVCAESGQIQLSGWGLCHSPDNIAQRKFFCVRTFLDWADTYLLGGFRGSWPWRQKDIRTKIRLRPNCVISNNWNGPTFQIMWL
jgi:hypothetical protein